MCYYYSLYLVYNPNDNNNTSHQLIITLHPFSLSKSHHAYPKVLTLNVTKERETEKERERQTELEEGFKQICKKHSQVWWDLKNMNLPINLILLFWLPDCEIFNYKASFSFDQIYFHCMWSVHLFSGKHWIWDLLLLLLMGGKKLTFFKNNCFIESATLDLIAILSLWIFLSPWILGICLLLLWLSLVCVISINHILHARVNTN